MKMQRLPQAITNRVIALAEEEGVRQIVKDYIGSVPFVVAGGVVRDLARGGAWKDVDVFVAGERNKRMVVGKVDLVIVPSPSVWAWMIGMFDFNCCLAGVRWDGKKWGEGFCTAEFLRDVQEGTISVNPRGWLNPHTATKRAGRLLVRGWRVGEEVWAEIDAAKQIQPNQPIIAAGSWPDRPMCCTNITDIINTSYLEE